MIEVNLIGSRNFAAAVLPRMTPGAQLALIASLAGLVPNFLMRVVLEPLGVWLGLLSGRLAGAWIGMAGGNVAGGLLCLGWLAWRLRVYARGAATGPRQEGAPLPASPA